MDANFEHAVDEIQEICQNSNNRSQFFRYGSHGYKNSVRHYFDSSSEIARAAVEPGHKDDLAEITSIIVYERLRSSTRRTMEFTDAHKQMKVLARRSISFAVKSGGHNSNPGFSSTTGIQIAMSRFNDIRYHPRTRTLDVGAGCTFDEIYKEIQPLNINIVGGSAIEGIGVGGWLLGGGYSLKTNQFGLGIDNIAKFQIVVPEGYVIDVAEGDLEYKELFEAIKGGGNNFGIITRFTLKTHPQGPVYGDVLVFHREHVERVKVAIDNFIKNNIDPKAVIVAAFRHYRDHGEDEFKFTVQFFFDGPKPNPDPFQEFLDILGYGKVAGAFTSGLREMSYARLDEMMSHAHDFTPQESFETPWQVKFSNGIKPELGATTCVGREIISRSRLFASQQHHMIAGMGMLNARARWGSVMVSKYTRRLIDEVEKEAEKAQKVMKANRGRMVVAEIWPFLPTMFDNSSPAAWPHVKGQPNGPLVVYFLWDGKGYDEFWINQMKDALANIRAVALSEKCTTDSTPVYWNTTLGDTPVQDIYRNNLTSLSAIRAKYDPKDIMKNTGGFRIPLPYAWD